MKKLLNVAKEKDKINVTGCYLDIIHNLAPKFVSQRMVDQFYHEKEGGRLISLVSPMETI